ncbi:MAG: homoserine kinase [Chloroflexi bacterium]|nr:MAG: homoserine kinase [Chloroflexota bacterium]
MARAIRLRVPASSANLGPGFDVLALALDLQLWVSGREAAQTEIRWLGEGAREVPLDGTNLIVRAAEEPFRGWARPLEGLELTVGSKIPIGRGLGSSAAAIAAGVLLGARLRGLRLTTQRALELGFPLEGHGDNLAAALHGGFCVAVPDQGGVRVHRLTWPAAWRCVILVPDAVSPTEQARRLVPEQPARADAIFNMARVAEWVIACSRRDGRLLASAMQDRLHQPGRRQAYPYLDDVIAAALAAGALGAALSGAGGSVLAVVDRKAVSVGRAMAEAARQHKTGARILRMGAAPRGAG